VSITIVQFLIYATYLGIALFVLVRSAELFLSKAKHIGASFGLSHFAIGIIIVAFGTSLPELASSLVAALTGNAEVVIATVVGSNITNILFIVGVLVLFAGKIVVDHELVRTELPIFFIATALFAVMVFDGRVDRLEAALLVGTFCTYVWYLLWHAPTKKLPEVAHNKQQHDYKTYLFALLGLFGLLVGAHYTVAMTVDIATLFSVPVGLVSILAVAFGTSLPEFFVSLHAMRNGEDELVIGNVFGANAFNLLMVIGVPALIAPLTTDTLIISLGLPVLLAASVVFFITSFSRQIMRWEGVMMLLLFTFFITKLILLV
jgi:cation:H+ antiporter